jgi:hypothetical protein
MSKLKSATVENAEAKPGCAPVSGSETVRVELKMRVLEYYTFEREVNKAEFDHQRKHGDVASWLDEKFKDDPMPDSDISTESFELDEWKLLESPNA